MKTIFVVKKTEYIGHGDYNTRPIYAFEDKEKARNWVKDVDLCKCTNQCTCDIYGIAEILILDRD